MAEPLLLPIRANGSARHDHSNLEARLRQIDQQKGAFRHVTEESLLAQIEKADGGVQDVDMAGENDDSSEDETDDTLEGRHEKVWKAREQMLKQLDRAKNDALHALDFVSLLLSKHSDAAQSSMSPFLQQSVPIGTLDGRLVNHVEPPPSTKRRLDAVARGWKTKSFTSAAENLLSAGARLEVEATQESSFWEQVARVKEHGWAVSRLPRDSHVIGVHFGLSEAAPRFRTRGFALLRRDDDGRLQMDRTTNRLRLQAVVLRGGKDAGRSVINSTLATTEDKIHDQILDARNSLFEEEVFYQASREGRSIANQGVSVSAKTIKFDIGDDCQIQIELVDPGKDEHSAAFAGNDQALADLINWTLRILLTHAHSQNLARRSESPQPISLQPKPVPEYALLRPIISHLRHESTLSSFRSWFSKIEKTFATAGLSLSSQIRGSAKGGAETPLAGGDGILKLLLETADTSLELKLPTNHSLHLTIRTHMAPPMYGTEYAVDNLAYDFMTLKPPHMSSLIEIKSFIYHVLTIDLVAVIASIPTSTTSKSTQYGASDTTVKTWKIRDPHSGEIFLETSGRALVGISTRVQHEKIGVRVQDYHRANGSTKLVLIWESDKFSRNPADSQQDTQPQQQLVEILREFIATRP